ncbi:MAG: hypothetical protein HUK21_10345 [Fibrobacteraceae bacterium]|nr:hypothetical protein [Fibrobacteraceae bacterium]
MAKKKQLEMNIVSRLDKYSLKVHELMVKAKFSLKAKEDGASHTMLRDLIHYGIELDGIFNGVGDFCFSKTTIPLEEYELDMDVTFDAVTLKARLVSINITSKKDKEGNTLTEYSFNFEKDAGKEDFDLVIPYFKVKEPEEDADANLVNEAGIQDLASGLDGRGRFKRKKARPYIFYGTSLVIE